MSSYPLLEGGAGFGLLDLARHQPAHAARLILVVACLLGVDRVAQGGIRGIAPLPGQGRSTISIAQQSRTLRRHSLPVAGFSVGPAAILFAAGPTHSRPAATTDRYHNCLPVGKSLGYKESGGAARLPWRKITALRPKSAVPWPGG